MPNHMDVIPPLHPDPEVLAALVRVHYRGDPVELLTDVVRHPRKYGVVEDLGLWVNTLRELRHTLSN